MEALWRYVPQSGFTNRNAGFSMWCFGTYKGKEYFIKQFLTPKYPAQDTVSSAEKIARKIKACEAFEQRRRRLYARLSELSDGNDVRILEFFRVSSRYYIVTEKVEALPWTVETIAALDEREKRRICAIIAHAIAALHKGSMVHSDIKHDNILYAYTPSGQVTAKIIDFDGGFLESDPPSVEEGVTGDTNYFSPEVCARAYGEDQPLTAKLDVFALGVLFHQYFSGQMPGFDREEASCPGEAVLQGCKLRLSEELPQDVAELLEKMLSQDPRQRPCAQEVFALLRPYRPAQEPASSAAAQEPASSEAAQENTAHAADEAAPEESERFCTICGRCVSGAGAICDSCAAKPPHSRSLPNEGKVFFLPGDL